MKIRFETTFDDLVAFNIFHVANSPAWRRQLWIQTLLVPGVCLVLFLLTYAAQDGQDGIALEFVGLTCLIVSGLATIFVRLSVRRNLKRQFRKFLSEGSNHTLLGWREMELVGRYLLLETEYIQSRIDLRAIEKIVGNEEYTFIYIASVSAYVIPMQRWPEEEFRDFVAELRAAWKNPAPIPERVAGPRQSDEITSLPPPRTPPAHPR